MTYIKVFCLESVLTKGNEGDISSVICLVIKSSFQSNSFPLGFFLKYHSFFLATRAH